MYLDFNEEFLGGDEPTEDQIIELLRSFGQIYVPKGEDEQEAYQHAIRGKCMACGRDLEGDTIVLIDARGVLGVWDSAECCSNMHALSFLREVEEAVVTRIEERENEDPSEG